MFVYYSDNTCILNVLHIIYSQLLKSILKYSTISTIGNYAVQIRFSIFPVDNTTINMVRDCIQKRTTKCAFLYAICITVGHH